MALGRAYSSDITAGMKALVGRADGSLRPVVRLIGRQYAGTKVMPFRTFGVTAAITMNGKTFMGTGVAPMATSGGVREPQAIGDISVAKENTAGLERILNGGGYNVFDPFSVDNAVLDFDRALAAKRGLKDARPTSGIGSEVAIASTIALLDAQAAFHGIPTALAMRAILLSIQGLEPNVEGLVAPLPKFNILNFGKHSGTKRPDGLPHVWLQETKIAPVKAASFEEALFMGIEVLNAIIKIAGVDNVGFEAGISPALTSPEQVYEMAAKAIEKAGLAGKVFIAADAAASEFSRPETEGSSKYLYDLYPGKAPLDAEAMVKFWATMVDRYNLHFIEDGMNSEDTAGWTMMMSALKDRVEIQGDDIFVTDAEETRRLSACANSILIKPNQAGTIVRTLKTIAAARELGYTISPSHRSGKVPGGYGMIPELCLGTQAEWIKPGAPRRERQGFVNNVLTLSDELALLGINVGYAGPKIAKKYGL